MDEVNKLLATNFIREVYYPKWLANVVIVKKSKREVKNVCRFHRSKSSLPEGQFSLTKN